MRKKARNAQRFNIGQRVILLCTDRTQEQYYRFISCRSYLRPDAIRRGRVLLISIVLVCSQAMDLSFIFTSIVLSIQVWSYIIDYPPTPPSPPNPLLFVVFALLFSSPLISLW